MLYARTRVIAQKTKISCCSPSIILTNVLIITETETFWNEWADVRELFGGHPVSSTDQWSRIEEQIRIPLNISFLNQTYCGSQPLSLVLAHYEAYGKIAPNRRNPT